MSVPELRASENPAAGFSLLRFFALIGFVSIVLAAILLALLFLRLVIPQIIQHSAIASQTVAQTLIDSLRPELDDYLTVPETGSGQGLVGREPSPQLLAHFNDMLRETPIVRIKLYNRQGIVVFSTDRKQIGENRIYDAGFVTAGSGRVASNFIQRGSTSYEMETEHDNLLETYVPVRMSPGGPVAGVLEIYTDMNRVVARNNQIILLFLAGTALILLGHLAVVILAARRASKIVAAEKRVAMVRTEKLESLAQDLLNREDAEKRTIATDLHEGLGQMLSAIKFNLELTRERLSAGKENGRTLASTVPTLQDSVDQVRGLAARLWPFGLGGPGLLTSIAGFCGEFERLHAGIRLEEEITLHDSDVPDPLKVVIYRIIAAALRSFALNGDGERVILSLRLSEQTIILGIENVPVSAYHTSAALGSAAADLDTRFAEVRERSTLSGGTFLAARSKDGGITLRVAWKL